MRSAVEPDGDTIKSCCFIGPPVPYANLLLVPVLEESGIYLVAINPDSGGRFGPGSGNVGLAGEVEDHIGEMVSEQLGEPILIEYVGSTRRPVGRHHLAALGEEVVNQVSTHESGGTGDQCPHRTTAAGWA